MKLIFTRSHKPLSLLIRWGTGEPVTHMAIVFDDFLVFQSNLLGVGLEAFEYFKKSCEIVYTIDYPMDEEAEEAVYKALIPKFYGQPYGWGAFVYDSWRLILKKFLRIPMPKVNPMDSASQKLCFELVEALPPEIVPWNKAMPLAELGMSTPYELYLRLLVLKEGAAQT